MSHTSSAKKRLRQNEKKKVHNRSIKRATKTFVKRFFDTLESGTVEESQQALNLAVKKIDQTAAKGIIHKNTASRKKSQLALAMNKKSANPPTESTESSEEE